MSAAICGGQATQSPGCCFAHPGYACSNSSIHRPTCDAVHTGRSLKRAILGREAPMTIREAPMTIKRSAGHFLIEGTLFILFTCSAYAQTPASTPPAAVPVDPTIELAKAFAWPIAALLIAVLFRRPISAFMSVIGRRITKFSIFKLEVELPPAKAATTAPLLDDIRAATTSAEISELQPHDAGAGSVHNARRFRYHRLGGWRCLANVSVVYRRGHDGTDARCTGLCICRAHTVHRTKAPRCRIGETGALGVGSALPMA